jgi:DNA primase
VLVDVEDVRVANALAHEILGRSLDELSRPGRSLLLQLDEMVEQQVERLKKETPDHVPPRTAVTFSRREIREATGWAPTRVHRYLKELVELEYVLIDSGRNGTTCRYRLAYEGQGKDGSKFMLGLTDPDKLVEDPEQGRREGN